MTIHVILSFTENFGSNAKKLNTCRNLKLHYTRRQSLGNYMQHYIKYTTLNLSMK